MVTIAKRIVSRGDKLYHLSRQKWGTVIGFDEGSAVLRITADGQPDNYTDLHVLDGGLIKGKRQVYWHEPLDLDLPYEDLTKIQKVVDFYLAELA